MKRLTYFLLIIFFVLSACEKDPCKDVVCINGGCDNGTCQCDAWYEGDQCQTEMRTKFYGNFYGTLSYTGNSEKTNFTISKDGNDVQKINIDGPYALLNSSTSFNVPNQTLTVNSINYGLSGTGTLDGNKLTFDFSMSDQGITSYFHFEGTRNKSSLIDQNTLWQTVLLANCLQITNP